MASQNISARQASGPARSPPDGLTAAVSRARHHRLPLHLDLSDLEPDQRINKAAAFFAGLLSSLREDWPNTVLVVVDEGYLLAPHLAASARDAARWGLGMATMTDLSSRGRKRGICPVIATQRLAKLASSVVSELHNMLVGVNVYDRDVSRAADLLGFGSDQAAALRTISPNATTAADLSRHLGADMDRARRAGPARRGGGSGHGAAWRSADRPPVGAAAPAEGRSCGAVYAQAGLLGLTEGAAPYAPWEIAQIRAGYALGTPVAQLGVLIGRPASGITTVASRLQIRHANGPHNWSGAEQHRALELAETGLQYVAIAGRMHEEGFPRCSGHTAGQTLRRLGYERG